MFTMDQIHHIRALYYEQGRNISDIAKETGYNWKTIAKYIDKTDFNEQKVPTKQQFCPKLDPFKSLIDSWLEEDRKHHRKQRHTAKRVFRRLQTETEGFDCSYRLVAEYVSQKKKELNLNRKEGYLPLEHFPGEAQADFGKAEFYERGRLIEGKYFVLSFPWSNAGFQQINYGENTECLLEAMDNIFRHIGGVPEEIWFDNTSTIVTNIIKGGGREITERFSRFMDHYGFRAVFMNPDEGHEKGNVENKVGYTRKNLLVPVPRFLKLEEFNRQLLCACDDDHQRRHYYKDADICDLFRDEKKHLRPLPSVPFDLSSRINGISTNGYGKFTLDNGKHEYSSAPGYANTRISVKLTSGTVTVLDENDREIVTHRRLYGDERQSSMEWVPYLNYIARHPRSLKNTGIYSMMPERMQTYINSCSHDDKKDILHVLSELTDRTGFDSAMQTVNQAITYQANDPDSLRSLYNSIFSDVPQLPPLTGDSTIPNVKVIPVRLNEYDSFLKRGGVANG